MLTPHRSRPRVVLALLGALLPGLVVAQDLATLAKKEKARRSKVTKPVKVMTEEDGKDAATKGSGSVTALSSDSTNVAPRESVQEGPGPEGPQEWKSRADSARNAVTSAEAGLAQQERALEAYRSDMTPPTAADLQDPMREQKRSARLYEMTKQIETQKAVVAEAKKALSALEDEARSKGVPPGWIR